MNAAGWRLMDAAADRLVCDRPDRSNIRYGLLRVIERADFADDLADLQKSAGVEFRMSPFHRLDVFRMRAPGLQRLFRREAENRQLFAVIGFERFDGQEAR